MSATRKWNPYEKNQLTRYGIDWESIAPTDTRPVEYITGKVAFCDHIFNVTTDTLIPRVESEQIVTMSTTYISEQFADKPISILDMGTGSGALAISIFANFTPSQQAVNTVILADISKPALEIAKKNAKSVIGDTKHFQFIKTDLWNNVPDQTFDVIVANLPYIPSQRISNLEASVKDHEPLTALDGGETGAELILRFLEKLENHIHSKSFVLLEIDEIHTLDFLSKLDAAIAINWHITEHSDCFDRHRFLVVKKKT